MADAQGKRIVTHLYVGTMGWSYDFWKGSFYPANMAPSDFLSFYSERFSTVEVDNTFYRIPREQTVTEWAQATPSDFLFSLKFPQKITHMKLLRDCQEETKIFLERVELLGEKLGALLLQFPPMFNKEHLPLLRDYLRILPETHRYIVEVRNNSMLNEELFGLLREHNTALAWVDSSKMPFSSEETADFVYIRWEGDRKAVTGTVGKPEIDQTTQIRRWADKLKPLLTQNKFVFGYFSKYYSGFPPNDVELLLKTIGGPESLVQT